MFLCVSPFGANIKCTLTTRLAHIGHHGPSKSSFPIVLFQNLDFEFLSFEWQLSFLTVKVKVTWWVFEWQLDSNLLVELLLLLFLAMSTATTVIAWSHRRCCLPQRGLRISLSIRHLHFDLPLYRRAHPWSVDPGPPHHSFGKHHPHYLCSHYTIDIMTN